jgi:hypothetical protein
MGLKHSVVKAALRRPPASPLSACRTDPSGGAFVLDERRGSYFHVDCRAFELLTDPSSGVGDNVADREALTELRRSGLTLDVGDNDRRPPPWSLVALYAAVNLAFSVRLASGSWRPVWRRRVGRPIPADQARGPTAAVELGPLVVAAARRASLFPWVTSSCVPAALSIAWILEGAGAAPRLAIGATGSILDAHMWVDLVGEMFDLAAEGVELDEFVALPGPAGR